MIFDNSQKSQKDCQITEFFFQSKPCVHIIKLEIKIIDCLRWPQLTNIHAFFVSRLQEQKPDSLTFDYLHVSKAQLESLKARSTSCQQKIKVGCNFYNMKYGSSKLFMATVSYLWQQYVIYGNCKLFMATVRYLWQL